MVLVRSIAISISILRLRRKVQFLVRIGALVTHPNFCQRKANWQKCSRPTTTAGIDDLPLSHDRWTVKAPSFPMYIVLSSHCWSPTAVSFAPLLCPRPHQRPSAISAYRSISMMASCTLIHSRPSTKRTRTKKTQ